MRQTLHIKDSHGSRTAVGAGLLAAARTLNTRPVKEKLAAFEQVHRAYCDAQAKLDTAATRLATAQDRVTQLDAAQDAAVEALARALVADNQPRTNPFAAFGGPSPSAIMHAAVGTELKAIRTLLGAVQRNKTLSKATQQAAQALDKASRAVEQALPGLDKPAADVRDARKQRDTIGQRWDVAYANLKRAARVAADDGAPEIYDAFYKVQARPAKRSKPAPAPQPTPSQAVTAS